MNRMRITRNILFITALWMFGLFAGSRVSRAQSPEIIWSQDDLNGGVTSVAFSPDGEYLAYSAGSDPDIRVRRASDGKLIRPFTTRTHVSVGVDQIAFSPVGLTLASTWNEFRHFGGPHYVGGLETWTASSPPSFSSGEHLNYVTSLAWSPDGESIVSGGTDQFAILWDANTMEQIRGFYHSFGINSVAFSPDGQIIATGGIDNQIKLWDISNGHLIHTLTGHTDFINTLEFSPDGSLLASGAAGSNIFIDPTIKIWRVSDGEPLDTFEGHSDGVNEVSFAFDGAILGSASRDGTIRFWRVADGAELIRYDFEEGIYPITLDVAPDDGSFSYGLNNGRVVHATP